MTSKYEECQSELTDINAKTLDLEGMSILIRKTFFFFFFFFFFFLNNSFRYFSFFRFKNLQPLILVCVLEKYYDILTKYEELSTHSSQLSKELEKKEIELTTINKFFADRENEHRL